MKRTPLKRKTSLKNRRTKRIKNKVKRVIHRLWSMEKADKMFSLYIRKRDGKCMRCGKPFDGKNLTNSHFWARQHKATRYDPKNCVAVCWMPCHKYHWEKEKQGDYRNFMLQWLGDEEYLLLELRARSVYPLSNAIIDCMRLLGGAPENTHGTEHHGT